MSWLRVDDGFDTHPKILALGTDGRRWTWNRILLYTCRYQSPTIPPNINEFIPKSTKKFLQDCVQLGLIDINPEGEMEVHDWPIYNASTVVEKVGYYLKENPHDTANDVYKAIGGNRNLVLALVRHHKAGINPVPEVVPEVVSKYHQGGIKSGSPTGIARAKPVPNYQTNEGPTATNNGLQHGRNETAHHGQPPNLTSLVNEMKARQQTRETT